MEVILESIFGALVAVGQAFFMGILFKPLKWIWDFAKIPEGDTFIEDEPIDRFGE